MSQRSRSTLKGYFETNDKPIEAEFIDLIDSKFNISEDDTDDISEGANNKFVSSAEKANIHTHSNKSTLDTYTQSEANLADAVTKKHASTVLGTKEIDETAIANGKVIKYNSTSGKLEYADDNEGAGGGDTDAIHDNVSAEISAITEKTTPVDADIALIEDSAASYAKKKLSWTNIKATLKTYFDTLYAVTAKGVTNGDSHDHSGGDGAQIDHGGLAGLSDDDHTQYIKHSLATAVSDFLVASGAGAFVKKTLAEVKTILGLGSAAYTASTDYAVAAKGVTNGDSHDHNGGDGAQIDHVNLSNKGTNTHSDIDTFIGSKASASGLASLDGSSKVVQDPANATATTTASKIPIADGSGKLDTWITDGSDTAKGKVELATAAETTTGTDATRAVTPDGLAGSVFGKKTVMIKIIDDATALTTGDGKVIFVIPPEINGMNLVDADAHVSTVSSSGTPTIQIRNVTDSQDMLSTAITIDANEKTSYTAAAAPVINTSYDDVATGDEISIDVDVAGTGTKGLTVVLTFQLP